MDLPGLLKISAQTLNTVFDHICQDENTVCWINTTDWRTQIYLSPSFEKIFQWKLDYMYEDTRFWRTMLCPEDKYNTIKNLRRSDSNNFDPYILFYKLKTAEGEIKHVCDKHFSLQNNQGKLTAFSGIAEVIPKELWYERRFEYLKESSSIAKSSAEFCNRVERNLKLKSENPTIKKSKENVFYRLRLDENLIELSAREAESLYYLIQGKSSKQIASIMNISSRTVEIHLDKIRAKTQTCSRVELLSKIDHRHIGDTWRFDDTINP